MESLEHSFRLKDGRILAYHTFPEAEEKSQQGLHPVLYFHGYPGYGCEAGNTCARSVASHGGRIYAIDRPGMGKTSSPYEKRDTDTNPDAEHADSNLDTFISNVWELVEDQGWKEFSVIGVSGGGPSTLAILASYLQRRQELKETNEAISLPILRNVCLVAGICMSAGSDGMKKDLTDLANIVEDCQTSRWSRFKLGMMSTSVGPMYNYMIPAMPLSWVMYLNSLQNEAFPPADKKWMSDENNVGRFLSSMRYLVAQGGYPGVYDDSMILFRARHTHEDILAKIYGTDAEDNLPEVRIFQGGMDVSVPPSHARYMHESIFQKRSKLLEFDGLGHVSMVTKADEYAVFATAARK